MKLIWPSALTRPKSAMSSTEQSNHSLISDSKTNTLTTTTNNNNNKGATSSINKFAMGSQATSNTASSKASEMGDSIARHNDLVVIKYRYTALIAFFIGFLAVWSLAIAYVMVRGQFLATTRSDRAIDVHISQEKISRVMFSVGQEMLFTVDAMVSIQMNLSYSTPKIQESLEFTWNLTDEDIRASMDSESYDVVVFLMEDTQAQLQAIRTNLSLESSDPLAIINGYKQIFRGGEDYFLSIKQPTGRTENLFLQLESHPYSTLIMGMDNRFIELAYGTLYHIGYSNTSVLNEYNYYFYSSYDLIVNAFRCTSLHREAFYLMLHNKTNEVYNFDARLSTNNQNGRKYTKFVTEVVAYLLNMKDVFNDIQEELLGLPAVSGSSKDSVLQQLNEHLSRDDVSVDLRPITTQSAVIFYVVFFALVLTMVIMAMEAKRSTKIKNIINSKTVQLPVISTNTMSSLRSTSYPFGVETLY